MPLHNLNKHIKFNHEKISKNIIGISRMPLPERKLMVLVWYSRTTVSSPDRLADTEKSRLNLHGSTSIERADISYPIHLVIGPVLPSIHAALGGAPVNTSVVVPRRNPRVPRNTRKVSPRHVPLTY